MKVTIEHEVNHCNDCPYFKEIEDTSVCFDSFDEPNYDWYCTNKEADNSEYNSNKYNNNGMSFIGGCLNRFGECEIPEWCPVKKNENNQKNQ